MSMSAGRSVANPPHAAVLSISGTDRQTDGRRDGHTDARAFHRPCSAVYYSVGVNNSQRVRLQQLPVTSSK